MMRAAFGVSGEVAEAKGPMWWVRPQAGRRTVPWGRFPQGYPRPNDRAAPPGGPVRVRPGSAAAEQYFDDCRGRLPGSTWPPVPGLRGALRVLTRWRGVRLTASHESRGWSTSFCRHPPRSADRLHRREATRRRDARFVDAARSCTRTLGGGPPGRDDVRNPTLCGIALGLFIGSGPSRVETRRSSEALQRPHGSGQGAW
jgi:hypothetical protein